MFEQIVSWKDVFWKYLLYINFEYLFEKILLCRWWSENEKNPHKKHLQQLGYEFHIYQKAWNGNLITFLFSGKGIPKLFYFQGRESSSIN